MIYRTLFRLVLRRIPPETAHSLAARTLSTFGKVPGFRALLRRFLAAPEGNLEVRAFGLTFPNPLGVAAGTDKNLTWFEELGALGFGFVEVGTVTALPQRGNPRPRIHRVLADRALINSMGFPNNGATAAARRLRKRTGPTLIAVNIGKSKAATEAAGDYRESVRQLAPLADLLVLNVSSPNTPGLRDLQTIDALSSLVREVRVELTAIDADVPLLVKISPDLHDSEIDAIAHAAMELGLAGIVAVNTTTTREGLGPDGVNVSAMPGGLSGPPLKRRAVEVLRRLHRETKGELVLVSVGGVETAADALERIRAGATLVQAYTGFVYGGPLWPSRINRGLMEELRARDVGSIQDLVGSDVCAEGSPGDTAAVGGRVAAIPAHPTSH
ncbi:MAG TPA: quinone-dependent dihydroorotate dehydrogenase [Solirubrobacteraceae bacterium]|nr:quinone-dependent dihydroorotate dehydrogenase [Solirubrobacteraceae bacterium]